MEIRHAEEKDLESVMKYDCHIHVARLAQCIKDNLVYILCDNGETVGVLRYNLFWQSVPFLDLLYIDELYRGKGFGSQMMRIWENAMYHKSYSHVLLSTQEDETAKFFYEKIGYQRIGSFLPPDQEAYEIMYCKRICG